MVGLDLAVSDEEDESEEWSRNGGVVEEREVEKALYALGREAVKNAQPKKARVGNEDGITPTRPKPNFEIPRKVLHSSIGSSLPPHLLIC